MILVRAKGTKVKCPWQHIKGNQFLQEGSLPNSTYFFWVRARGIVIGSGKWWCIDHHRASCPAVDC
jgi:hypothetical protein